MLLALGVVVAAGAGMNANETNGGFVYSVFVQYLTLPVRAAVAFFALLKLVKVCVLPLAERCASTDPLEGAAISAPRGASQSASQGAPQGASNGSANAGALEKVGTGDVTVVSAVVAGVAITEHTADTTRVCYVEGDVKFTEELRLAQDGLLYNRAEFVEFYGGACLSCLLHVVLINRPRRGRAVHSRSSR